MKSKLYDCAWFFAELVLFIVLMPLWVPLLFISLGYSLFCPRAIKRDEQIGL